MFTDSLKWDLFVIYIFISLYFVGSCCILVYCMFLCCPAKTQAEVKKSKRSIQDDINQKKISLPVISLNTDSKNQLSAPQRSRSKSLIVTRPSPHCEDEPVRSGNKLSFLAVIEPLQVTQLEEPPYNRNYVMKTNEDNQISANIIITEH